MRKESIGLFMDSFEENTAKAAASEGIQSDKKLWIETQGHPVEQRIVATLKQWLEVGIGTSQIGLCCHDENSKQQWQEHLELFKHHFSQALIDILTISDSSMVQKSHIILPDVAKLSKPELQSLMDIPATQWVGFISPWQLDSLPEDILSQWNIGLPQSVPESLPVSLPQTEQHPWFTVKNEASEAVLGESHFLEISPSSLSTFLKCPRQYFYQSCLKITDDQRTSQSILGTLTHRILEIFNRHYTATYTLEALLDLTTQFFSAQKHWPTLEKLGVTPRDFNDLEALFPNQKAQIEQRVKDSFVDLNEKGYFNVSFEKLSVETTVKASLGENTTLKGKLDLVRHRENGTLEIVDYKTSSSQYSAKTTETNLRPIQNALAPIDETLSHHAEKYQNRDYQLPLYWLMTRQQPEYQNKPIDITIQVVRPAHQNNGAITLTIPHSALETAETTLKQFLTDDIFPKLRYSRHFSPEGAPDHCKNCSYKDICDAAAENSGGEEQ